MKTWTCRDLPISPKRGHEEKPDRSTKHKVQQGSDAVPMLDLTQMQKLLEEHSSKILAAPKDNLDGMMKLFQTETSERLDRWTGAPKLITHIDRRTLAQMATECTKPKPGKGYRGTTVKAATRAGTDEAWKQVHGGQEKSQVCVGKAVDLGGHTGGLGASPQAQSAEKHGVGHPLRGSTGGLRSTIHEHLRKIYQTGNMLPELPSWQSEATAFTEQELTMALGAGHRGKAVGADGTELLPATPGPGGGLSSP